ncbi:MAG TPA: M23 family metallopeptidase, partial [Chitinophagales bacterium]|nr:M23 family metallopeptidase [Chitinophagales bacterium]
MKNSIHTLKKLFAVCCILTSQFIHSTNTIAQSAGYFRNPLDIPIALSANFGEIRSNHFHTGFDIRTNAETGYKVYAAADGVISRIKVSATGFGNVLYISHPNGYMTVYGHLDRFNDAIAAYVKQQQYAKQSFEVELFPDAGKFPVKKSDLIAYSGNSGSSGGPHLHFEIRDASGETFPLNPAAFYALDDTIPPKFSALYLYGIDKTTGDPVKYSIKKNKSGYALVNDSVTINKPVIGVAVEAADYMNHASNDYGIFEYRVKLDGQLIYSVKFDRFDFSNGRYVNAFTD